MTRQLFTTFTVFLAACGVVLAQQETGQRDAPAAVKSAPKADQPQKGNQQTANQPATGNDKAANDKAATEKNAAGKKAADKNAADKNAADKKNADPKATKQYASPSGQPSAGDRQLVEYFAAKLMLMNDSTIRMSKLAERSAASPKVKEFAQQLVKGHEELNQQLRECAPQAAQLAGSQQRHTVGYRGDGETGKLQGENSDSARANHSPEDASAQSNAAHSSQNAGSDLVQQILNVERQAASNYAQSSWKMLQQYNNQDFNMGFLGFQIGAHTWALAELNAMKSLGDSKFQNLVADASKSIEQHLQHAVQLSNELEDDRTSDASEPSKEAKSGKEADLNKQAAPSKAVPTDSVQ